MYIKGYFIVLYDLTPDLAAVEAHTLPDTSGTMLIELTFKKALKKAITCLLYLEYNFVRVDCLRIVTTDY
jgi:hypothetical protein